MNKKKLCGVLIAVLIIAASFIVPATESLSQSGITTIALQLAFLIMLIFETLPIIVTCLIVLALLPISGATASFANALTGFANPIVFFIFASFGIAAAFTTVPLSKRILISLLKVFGRNVKSMFFAIMLCAALVSAVVSNVPTCAICMAIGLNFLELYDDPVEKKRTGRAFMIGIPVASMIGGMMTPAGSSINLMAIGLLEQFTGETITFVQWMCAGIPLTILILPVAWWLIVRIYKPVEINGRMVQNFIKSLDVPPKMNDKEKKVIVITLTMLVLWILSSWVSQINVMVVASLGCCTFFLPGIKVLSISSFLKNNSWDSFFLVGTVVSIGTAMVTNGVSDWIVSLMPTMNAALLLLIAFIAALIFVMLVIIPVAPSLVTIMASPLIALAIGASASPALAILVAGLCACNCYLLPLDTVTLLTYGKGYYSMTDMAKSTLPLQIWIIIVMSLWLPVVGLMFGWV